MTLYELLGAIEVGLVFGLVALGAFLSFRILDFPDLTVEGSFPLGAAVAAVLIVAFGWNPWLATAATMPAGFAAGLVTAFLNVRYNILHILCGILVSIALYSVNLRIMGGPNKPLLGVDTVFSAFGGLRVSADVSNLLILGFFAACAKVGLDLFLATGVGISMRAAGSNPAMAGANGIDVGRMKLIGIGMANALTAVAGALFAQLFGAADVYMGIGVVIIGLASVIVGLSVLPVRSVFQATFACLIGAIVYRLAVALALNTDSLGLHPSDVQLVTAVLVASTLIWQARSARRKAPHRKAAP
jgi:putative ABC transport system permease protein